MTFLCWTQKRQNNFPWISLKIWVISSKGTYYFQLNSQLLATNKSKKKNFSLHNVNNKHFKANSSDGEDNSEHFKTNSSHGENPLIAHSTAAWALSYLCKAYLVNSLLKSGKEVETILTKLFSGFSLYCSSFFLYIFHSRYFCNKLYTSN